MTCRDRLFEHSVRAIVMALASVFLLVYAIQVVTLAQQPNASLLEFDWKASGVVHEARTQMVILINQLMTNATIITQIAEGNASLLLANLYNEINRGISEAQVKASQIGNSFQMNLSKSVDDVMRQAGSIYTLVETSLRNSTNYIEETAVRLLNHTEVQLASVVSSVRANLAGGPKIAQTEPPATAPPVADTSADTPESESP